MTNSFGKTASEMLDDMKDSGVSVTMFHTFGKWFIHLDKEHEGIKLEIKINTQFDFLATVREAHDKWHQLLEGKMAQHLGVPQIEHKKVEAPPRTPMQELHAVAAGEAAQEAVEEAPGTDPDMQF